MEIKLSHEIVRFNVSHEKYFLSKIMKIFRFNMSHEKFFESSHENIQILYESWKLFF